MLADVNAEKGFVELSDFIRLQRRRARAQGRSLDWVEVVAAFRLNYATVRSRHAAIDSAKAIVQGCSSVQDYIKTKLKAFERLEPHGLEEGEVVAHLLKDLSRWDGSHNLFNSRHLANCFRSGQDVSLFVQELDDSGMLPVPTGKSSRVVVHTAVATSTGAPASSLSNATSKAAFDALPESQRKWYESSGMPGEKTSDFLNRMAERWGVNNCYGCGAADHRRQNCPVQKELYEKRQAVRAARAAAEATPANA